MEKNIVYVIMVDHYDCIRKKTVPIELGTKHLF